ncbi:MAG: NusG domain II-containing protein, partial [Clostridia bacterium]
GQFATISQHGETREVSLKHDAQISVDGAVIEVNNGRIRILESDCPDKICVKTGWISRGGQTIACVPLGIVITISGAASHDAIVS